MGTNYRRISFIHMHTLFQIILNDLTSLSSTMLIDETLLSNLLSIVNQISNLVWSWLPDQKFWEGGKQREILGVEDKIGKTWQENVV